MSLITISDLTTSESFISEISEVETGALVGGSFIRIKNLTVVANNSLKATKGGTILISNGDTYGS